MIPEPDVSSVMAAVDEFRHAGTYSEPDAESRSLVEQVSRESHIRYALAVLDYAGRHGVWIPSGIIDGLNEQFVIGASDDS